MLRTSKTLPWYGPYLKHLTTTHNDPNLYWAHFKTFDGLKQPRIKFTKWFWYFIDKRKKRSVFHKIEFPIPPKTHNSFLRSYSSHSSLIFDQRSCHLFEIKTWSFQIRKKHRLRVKPQICLPASEFAFPRTWPRSIMNFKKSKGSNVFSFIDFCHSRIYVQRVAMKIVFLHLSTPYHYDQNWK